MAVGLENQPSIYAGDPPDTGLESFGQLLDKVRAVIWSDGMFGVEEQRLFGAFMADMKMRIQQQMQQQQQQAAGQQQFTPSGGAPPLNEEPLQMGYGKGGGSEYVP